MGGIPSSQQLQQDSYLVNSSSVVSMDEPEEDPPAEDQNQKDVATPIIDETSTPTKLHKIMNQMRFYQNLETSEVLFLLGSDCIEEVPNITKDEWLEVNVSGLQDGYIRYTLQAMTSSQRQLFDGEMVETGSVSSDKQSSLPVKDPTEDYCEELVSFEEEEEAFHDQDFIEAFKSPTNSDGLSSQGNFFCS
jgi:hypothetical protein